MVKAVSGISSARGKRQKIILLGWGGFRGKLSKKFECSVHTSASVINGWLNISHEEGFSDG